MISQRAGKKPKEVVTCMVVLVTLSQVTVAWVQPPPLRGGLNIIWVRVCAANMGRFLALQLSKNGSEFNQNYIKTVGKLKKT